MLYNEQHKLGDIICEHYQMLHLLSRFGISLGFGDKTVKAICDENNVDCNTFLATVNYIITGETTDLSLIDLHSMMNFLQNAHNYYIDYCFPTLRRRLINVIDFNDDNKLALLIISLFDEYVKGLKSHLSYEDKTVFPYVRELLSGKQPATSYQISSFMRHHDQLDQRLMELKNVIIKYSPSNNNINEVNATLFDIFSCEADLKSHCLIEDNIFIPAVRALEMKLLQK
ncbi:MAG: hemerythrin domain-containing protein [Bacteroidales bacterium]|nr:hemerythrin domain-containing protein [Bacteroidales bacterium]